MYPRYKTILFERCIQTQKRSESTQASSRTTHAAIGISNGRDHNKHIVAKFLKMERAKRSVVYLQYVTQADASQLFHLQRHELFQKMSMFALRICRVQFRKLNSQVVFLHLFRFSTVHCTCLQQIIQARCMSSLCYINNMGL